MNEYLAVSCLDVINGHYEFLKSEMKVNNDCCHELPERPREFRLFSAALKAQDPRSE